MAHQRADSRLTHLLDADLRNLHSSGWCPVPQRLTGVAEGLVLTQAASQARIWRGKVFDRGPGNTVIGLNRIGLGSLESWRYRFTARIGRSLFADRDVLLLDHYNQDNPFYVRRFHDELVQIDQQRFLATSHYRWRGQWRFLCYFALLVPEDRSSHPGAIEAEF